MKLGRLTDGILVRNIKEIPEIDILGITVDSRDVKPGYLFIAVSGHAKDGHEYIGQAVENGAAAVVVEKDIDAKVPVIVVDDSQAAESLLSRRFYEEPDMRMVLAGITGTNGKTSTAFLVQSVFERAMGQTGIIGTVGNGVGKDIRPSDQTTPGASSLIRMLAGFRDSGCRSAVMEVSSHAAVQGRTTGLEFDVGVFTNITRDHLDYHGTFEEYIEAKRIFVDSLNASGRMKKEGVLAYNLDDGNVRNVAELYKGRKISFGLGSGAEIRAGSVRADLNGSTFVLETPDGSIDIALKLLGGFSIYNALSAATAAIAIGISLEDIKSGLESVAAIPGRFQIVRVNEGPVVVVDYAHTPDALESLLSFCRELGPANLISVFGCGGDRDRGKRPMMGKIAAEISDRVYVTSDNPRMEDPEAIIDEVMEGVGEGTTSVTRIADRGEAIALAIRGAGKDDLVVLAGKGHEEYQVVGTDKIHFSDIEEAGKVLHGLEVGYQD
ncbi:MAG: UDP-N-acetylmuramoyl-L-alanyl-D-glutamate--2,6-diaminopimelate ligase [Candidatus Krumholzibacteria bacterium]|nr:UDP-N-acetylmuramoyl-L-alanyl-D-glutamate--2,6-diaminopimelate ligase [Candidatus Krumholzibacteria bacterium]